MRGRDKVNFILLAVCMAVVAFAAVLIGYNVGFASAGNSKPDTLSADTVVLHDETADVTPAPQQVEKDNSTIALPGFERLTSNGKLLNAGNIFNPEQNTCYFIVTLIMPGGAEIYRSSYLAPGQSLGDVELLAPLKAGQYEGVVARYSCYALGDLKPLNGADVKFILEVAP